MTDTLDIAERHSATRAWLMTSNAVLLILYSIWAACHPQDRFIALVWPVLLGTSVAMLVTGGYVLKPRAVLALMNDELSLRNRAAAIRIALLATMLFAGATYYYAALVQPIAAVTALCCVAGPGIAIGLGRYAWLERR